jgi:hypothetical protein
MITVNLFVYLLSNWYVQHSLLKQILKNLSHNINNIWCNQNMNNICYNFNCLKQVWNIKLENLTPIAFKSTIILIWSTYKLEEGIWKYNRMRVCIIPLIVMYWNSALIAVLHFTLIVKPSIVRKTHTYMYKVYLQL